MNFTHHAQVFIGYETEGTSQDMPLEDLCVIMRENGFHVHATKLEAAQCDQRHKEEDES